MRSPMTLLVLGAASAIALWSGPASAQYGRDDNDDQRGYYQPPTDPAGYGQPGSEDPQGYRPEMPQGPITYGGMHPIPHDVGAGFCTIQGPHTHPYLPFDAHLFHRVRGAFYFVGDPYDFGYNQSLYWYRGNHPIAREFGEGFCYMNWPHRHQYAPSPEMQPYFRQMGGYLVYRGPWDPSYQRHREQYVGYFNNYYRSYYYGNRYYRIRPRHAYMGFGGFRGGVSPTPPAPPRERIYGVPPAPMAPPPAPPPAPAYGQPGRYVPAPPAYRGDYVPPPAPASR